MAAILMFPGIAHLFFWGGRRQKYLNARDAEPLSLVKNAGLGKRYPHARNWEGGHRNFLKTRNELQYGQKCVSSKFTYYRSPLGGSKWPWTHKMRTPFLLPKLLGEGRGIRMHQTGEGALADPMVRHGMGSMTAMGSRHWLRTFVNCNNFESKFQCKVSAKYSDTSFPILLSETGSSFMEKFASCRKACMRSLSPENTERIER